MDWLDCQETEIVETVVSLVKLVKRTVTKVEVQLIEMEVIDNSLLLKNLKVSIVTVLEVEKS